MNKIIGSIELAYETDLIGYELSVGIDIEKNKYYMPSLSFKKDYGYIHESTLACWDNENYLIETLYSMVLLPWVVDKSIPAPEDFANLLRIEGVRLEDFQGLYELFNKAIEMKFFEK